MDYIENILNIAYIKKPLHRKESSVAALDSIPLAKDRKHRKSVQETWTTLKTY